MATPRLSPVYAASLRQLEKTFEHEHLTEIGRDPCDHTPAFSRPLLRRLRNPHTSRADAVLRMAIEGGDLQKGDLPGLSLVRSSLNDETRMQVLLRTPAMIEAGCALGVYGDLSCLYIENIDSPDRGPVQVLPTPLGLRATVTHSPSGETFPVKGRLARGANPMTLFLGETPIIEDGWTAGADQRYAPPATQATADYVAQLDIEARALSRRMSGLPRYDAPAPKSLRGQSRNQILPDMGHLPSMRMTPARAAFFLRKTVTPDDASLGHLDFDPTDPILAKLRRFIELSLRLIHAEHGLDPRRQTITAGIAGPDPWNESAHLHVSFGQDLARRAAEFRPIVEDRIGAAAICVASRFFGVPCHLVGSSGLHRDIELAFFHGHYTLLSAHERITLTAEHRALRAEFDALALEAAA